MGAIPWATCHNFVFLIVRHTTLYNYSHSQAVPNSKARRSNVDNLRYPRAPRGGLSVHAYATTTSIDGDI